MNKNEIRDLIAKGRISAALQELTGVLAGHLQNDIILLQTRFNNLERQERLGIIESSNAGIERNRISSSVLSLLSEVPDQSTHPSSSIHGNTNHIQSGNSIDNPIGSANSASSTPTKAAKSILFAAANPSNQASLQTDVEHRTIKEEIQKGEHRGAFKFLPPQFAVRITELMRAFISKPQIVHFAGHGEQEGILVSNDQNESQLLNESTIKRLFRPLIGSTELMLLNSCYSAHQAELISKMGMIVIGHNLPIGDTAALSFAKGFYLGLSEGMSYEEAYNYGITAILAENAAYAEVIEVWKDGQRMDW